MSVDLSMTTVPQLKFLLVDDHEEMSLAYKAVLEPYGHQVEIAANGERALEILTSGYEPTFILVDYRMPKMSGMDLVHLVKERHPKLNPDQMVIFTSFSTDAPELTKVKSSGVRVFQKPDDLGGFLNFINQLVLLPNTKAKPLRESPFGVT